LYGRRAIDIYKIVYIHAKHISQFDELGEIQPSLTTLIFRDKALRFTQLVGNLHLRQP
jgi:hypothetical protein